MTVGPLEQRNKVSIQYGESQLPGLQPAEISQPEPRPRLWTLNFMLVCLSALSVYIAFHSLIPTLPVYIEKYGGSKGTAGLALAFLTAAAVVIRPVTGWALDGYGRRAILFAGLIVFLIPSVFYVFMIPLIPLLFFRLVQGFGWGICNTSQATVASDVLPRKRMGEGLGFFSLTVSISLATAPAIGLWLMDRFSFRVLFAAGSVLTAVSLVLAMLIRYPRLEMPVARARFVFMEKAALRPALVVLLVTVTYSSLLSFLALFARQKGMNSAGLFFITLAVTTLISRPLSGAIVDRKGLRGYNFVVPVGLVAVMAGLAVLARISTSLQLVEGGVLYGIGFGLIQPAMLTLCINSVPPARRGAANATYWTAFDIGVAAGSILWGMAADAFGYEMMFNLNLIPALLALAVYFFGRKAPGSLPD